MTGTAPLRGQTVLLTGASRGIVVATVPSLGAAGAHLVAHCGSHPVGAEDATADTPPGRPLLV